jgi:hypothetical protein
VERVNRLQAELQRLYFFPATGPGATEPVLVDPAGRVRALVLELGRPASWDALVQVWQGLQADLELPAPAIAVSGDGYQLWISLQQPVAAAQALGFLEGLRRNYLHSVGRERVQLHPRPDPAAPGGARHVEVVPPVERFPGQWAAFVAPDLASLFADEPWVDLPSSEESQADLLSRLQGARPADWQRALERLDQAASPTPPEPAAPASALEAAADPLAPRRFLLQVMNDQAAALHLRVEAAKALLPYFEGPRPF